MKTFTIILLSIFTVENHYAQTYELDFSGSGATTVVDSVLVENLNRGTSLTLNGDDILQLNVTTQVNSIAGNYVSGNEEILVYPNPMTDQSTLQFTVTDGGNVLVAVSDLSGRVIVETTEFIEPGRQTFIISGLNQGMYAVRIKTRNSSYTAKLICQGGIEENTKITCTSTEYLLPGESLNPARILKSTAVNIEMDYTEGDRLLFKGMADNYATIVTDVPTGNKTLTFDFTECKDADTNYYSVVHIGTQTWMAENLKTTRYDDNSAIPLVTENSAWVDLITPAFCWYENDEESYKNIYGALYNWYAVDTITNGSKSVCPSGWHVPSDAEWTILTDYLEGESVAGGKLKETGTLHWDSPNTDATNESGFTALPGSFRYYIDGNFGNNGGGVVGICGYWWSSTEGSETGAWVRGMYNNYSMLYRTISLSKNVAFSVRCVKD